MLHDHGMGNPRQRWVLAPIPTPIPTVPSAETGRPTRSTTPDDDPGLAALLDRAYAGTIDDDPDNDHVGELRVWREADGADDDASFVATAEDGTPIGACLIARDLGAPFLYEIVVDPTRRRAGLATELLRRSLDALARRGEAVLAGWVTTGNVASEALLQGHGFRTVTPPVEEAIGVGYCRAAAAARHANASADAVLAATSTEDGPTLWVIDRDAPATQVDVAGTSVRVAFIARDDERVRELARTAMPIRGAAWLLAQ